MNKLIFILIIVGSCAFAHEPQNLRSPKELRDLYEDKDKVKKQIDALVTISDNALKMIRLSISQNGKLDKAAINALSVVPACPLARAFGFHNILTELLPKLKDEKDQEILKKTIATLKRYSTLKGPRMGSLHQE